MTEPQTLKTFIENAGARLKPIEESTRRFIETTAERVRTTSSDGINWVEENLKAQMDKTNLAQRVEDLFQTHEFKVRLQRTLQTAIERFQFAPRTDVDTLNEEIAGLRGQVQTLKKNVDSLDRKMANRPLNRDLKAVRVAVDRLEAKINTTA